MMMAVPFFAVARGAFVTACLVIGGLLVLLSVVGLSLGLFFFFPAAVMLLTAAGLAARHPPARITARVAAWLMASAALAGFGLGFYHYYFPPSVILIVQESTPDRNSARLNSLADAIWKAGFTSVSVSTWTSARQLAVDAPRLPERGRQRLLRFVRAQPGVLAAYWCQGTQCNG
jgi:hypothetical protein